MERVVKNFIDLVLNHGPSLTPPSLHQSPLQRMIRLSSLHEFLQLLFPRRQLPNRIPLNKLVTRLLLLMSKWCDDNIARMVRRRLLNYFYSEVARMRLLDDPYSKVARRRLLDDPYSKVARKKLLDDLYFKVARRRLLDDP
ncbi:unnamed protein product, partial [Ilex paraguariensis]